jgi:hypothetical protein
VEATRDDVRPCNAAIAASQRATCAGASRDLGALEDDGDRLLRDARGGGSDGDIFLDRFRLRIGVPLADERVGGAHREIGRGARGTLIRHARSFASTRAKLSLSISMIVAPKLGSLMLGVRGAQLFSSSHLPALVGAIAVASEARLAHEEQRQAPMAPDLDDLDSPHRALRREHGRV